MKGRWTEDRLDSCKAINEFITREYGDKSDAVRLALLEDLLFKASGIQTHERAIFFAEAMYYALPRQTRQRFTRDFLGLNQLGLLPTKRSVDVGIMTVIKPELDAVLATFGLPYASRVEVDGSGYWFSEVETINGSTLSIVISSVGEARNVPCAIAVGRLLCQFSLGLMILVGIAAGPEDKVTLGDVVIPDRVYDYEHVRAELWEGVKVERPRPLYIDVTRALKESLSALDEQEARAHLLTTLQFVEGGRVPRGDLRPQFHHGTAAAGERLIADGSLAETRDFDERIRAGDQEDSGFAQACAFENVPWCIFRGISDYGTPLKGEDWQFAAALAAASSGYVFIEQSYRPNNAI